MLRAQISDKISSVTAGSYLPGRPLTITAELSGASLIERIEVAYRQFGQRDYRRAEMAIIGSTATASVPASELAPPFLEYYLILTLKNSAATETYPIENAADHPLRADLQAPETGANPWITVLTPEPGERVDRGDVLISFALSSSDTAIDRRSIKVFLDGADVSSRAVVTDRLVVLRPENLPNPPEGGSHGVRIELFDREGKLLTDYAWSFGVSGGAARFAAAPRGAWLYDYGVQLETRNENISSEITPYNRATVTASGTYDQYRFNGKLYATNEENDRRQPQNRFFIGAESPWGRVGYGDSYPVYPDLVMSGKRVRGVDGSVSLGFFNLDVSHGDIVRKIESDTVKTFPADSLAALQQRDSTAHFAQYDPAASRWAQLTSGTFNRDLTVIRPSFGSENSRIGFSYLKSSDDMGSIRYGSRPEENLVLGSDMILALDRRNIVITGQAAVSATNRDISPGTLTDAQIDSIWASPTYSDSYRNDIRRTRDLVSHFITVNQNLVPLSLKNLSTLAYETALDLNYFDNSFRFGYLRHGESFESFGQPFLRTDVKGFNVADRVRLADKRLFLSGGFELLKDNTANTKASTTSGATANFGVSYLSRTDLPNVTLAYLISSNVNDRSLADTLYAIDDRTDRVLVQLSKEFAFGARHSATLSVSTSTRDDHTVKNLDTRNTTVALSDNATFAIPLQATLSCIVNSSTFAAGFGTPGPETNLSYTTISGSAQYRLLEDRLRLSGSVSPTFGDIQRVLLDASARYYFLKNLSAQTQLFLYLNNKLFGNSNPTNDTIWSLILRLDV
jgi:hypothetical protein